MQQHSHNMIPTIIVTTAIHIILIHTVVNSFIVTSHSANLVSGRLPSTRSSSQSLSVLVKKKDKAVVVVGTITNNNNNNRTAAAATNELTFGKDDDEDDSDATIHMTKKDSWKKSTKHLYASLGALPSSTSLSSSTKKSSNRNGMDYNKRNNSNISSSNNDNNLVVSLSKSKQNQNNKNSKKKKSLYNNSTQPVLTSLPKDAVLTVHDLETILFSHNFAQMLQSIREGQEGTGKKKGKASLSSGGQLAFPQPSELTNRSIVVGTTISACVMCTILGITVYPGLWLVGLVVGANIGNRVAVLSTDAPEIRLNLFSSFIVRFGKKVAKLYLTCYDFCQGMWYLYKTGQLSYDYMKQYQALDEKFKLQEKVDAWNTRFQQGKVDFDRWERDNEVGRKILAGLRTVWLIEEKSLKKVSTKKKSKQQYRILEYSKKVSAWLNRLAYAFWNAITGRGLDDLKDIANGVKMSLIEINWETSARMIGSGFLAFFTVNLVVALFEVSPKLLSSFAFAIGILWPEWFRETYRNIRDLLAGTAAKSRAEKEATRVAALKTSKTKTSTGLISGNSFIEDLCNQIFPKQKEEEKRNGNFGDLFRRKETKKKNWWGGYDKDTLPKKRNRIRRGRDKYEVWGGAYRN